MLRLSRQKYRVCGKRFLGYASNCKSVRELALRMYSNSMRAISRVLNVPLGTFLLGLSRGKYEELVE